MVKRNFFFIVLLTLITCLYGQSRGTGALFDPHRYEQVFVKARQIQRQYQQIPSQASLKRYTPYPKSQGAYGTCIAWAVAYAARTMAESIAINRSITAATTANAFSPLFLYKSLSNDPYSGLAFPSALDLLKDTGVPRMLKQGEENDNFPRVTLDDYTGMPKFRIADYVRLFNPDNDYETRISAIKKSIAEQKPVVFGMTSFSSFEVLRGELWEPATGIGEPDSGHGMAIIGYDDNKYGGVFEIQNSWGDDWASKGYCYIRYQDLDKYMTDVYALIEDMTLYEETFEFEGSVYFDLFNSYDGIPVSLTGEGYYQAKKAYSSGTDFRIMIQNKGPAYVYCIGSDQSTGKTTLLFPRMDIESPALDYADNVIAYPGENEWIRMDNTAGVSYLMVLFSKTPLNISSIRFAYEEAKGSFTEKISAALGENYIKSPGVNYSRDAVSFSAKTKNKNAVIVLPIAIPHTK
jgi:hypothetical protein